MKDLRLYGYWRSSASWRARIGLHLCGVAFDSIPVHLLHGEHVAPEHLGRNPLGQVPVLAWTDADGTPRRLTQSIAILELLAEAHPGVLLPTDTHARARARQLAEIVNSGIQPFQNLWLTRRIDAEPDADGRAIGKEAIERGLAAMERECGLASDDVAPGAWLVGDAPSVADVCLVPQLYNARRFGIDVDAFPTLLRAEASAAAHPAFAAARPEVQPDAEIS